MGISCSSQLQKSKEVKQTIDQCNGLAFVNVPQNNNINESNYSQEYECLLFDSYQYKWLKVKYQIRIIKDNEIIYFYNGQIIRLIKTCLSLEPKIFNNLEQIQFLEWFGRYGKNQKKVDKWAANWNGYILQKVGGYYTENDQKVGFWKEIVENYCSKVLLFEEGEYHDNLRIGKWKYIYQNKMIGGGSFQFRQKKIGKWVELWENFCDYTQVIQKGEYNIKGMKVGQWDFFYCKWGELEYKQMGGGLYDKEGIKIGKWIELDKGFRNIKQVTCNGKYNVKGIKIGRWDFYYCKWGELEYQQIGGGSYNKEGIKIGKWIELDEGFCGGLYSKQVVYNGEYNMDGIKIDGWEINYDDGHGIYRQIGGGLYDKKGIKISGWIELDECFSSVQCVVYIGEYNTRGIKIDRWDISYDKNGDGRYSQMGGGSYDYQGFKIGRWIELDERFYCKQIVYSGVYNLKGTKVSRWDINYQKNRGGKHKYIGGGQYDKDGIKIGRWTELDEGFYYNKQVVYEGQYDLKGLKISRWDIYYKKIGNGRYKKIGGGSYNKDGTKVGKWVELWEKFCNDAQVTFKGVYNKKGLKTGKWNICQCYQDAEGKYKKIGGGSYDQEENQKKIGRWIELDEGFASQKQVTYIGIYNMKGIKIGTWEEIDIRSKEKFGEAQYDN
ncbi:unnamed protein product [Paramecium sonneborni]|uniref:Uncharacterized protein n=1 Tax=Paramecium sonneborni TaxID=65129 RepID=A0A8S1P1G4_9CILI|nr:unnamed protein product [Paramecium sonneborni]